jgi:hypothetical protein
MTSRDLEAMIRDVIIHLGLRFTVLSILESPAGWNIQLRSGGGGLMRFRVPDGRPSAMRVAIQNQLEAQP